MIISKKPFIIVLACQAASVLITLVLCQLWLTRVVDNYFAFWKPGERRDYAKPEEMLTFLSLHLLVVFITSLAVTAIASTSLRATITRMQGLTASIPALLFGVFLFEYLIQPFLPELFVPLKIEALSIYMWGGIVATSLLGPLIMQRFFRESTQAH